MNFTFVCAVMPIDTERQRLTNHRNFSWAPIQGSQAIFFSLPFLAAGIFILLASWDIIHVPDSKFHVPRNLVASFGALFFLAGLVVLAHGIEGLWHRAKVKRLRQQHPDEIWHADYSWQSSGASGDNLQRLINSCYGCLAFTLVMLPLNWFAFFYADRVEGVYLKIVLAFFNVLILISWGYTVYLLLQFIKYGNSFLQFSQFPFFLGERAQLTLKTKGMIRGLKTMTFILRCCEERFETRTIGRKQQIDLVVYQLYAETVNFEDVGRYQQKNLQWPLILELPRDPRLASSLSARPPVYWELEVKASTPGIDYHTFFLVPVYAREGDSGV